MIDFSLLLPSIADTDINSSDEGSLMHPKFSQNENAPQSIHVTEFGMTTVGSSPVYLYRIPSRISKSLFTKNLSLSLKYSGVVALPKLSPAHHRYTDSAYLLQNTCYYRRQASQRQTRRLLWNETDRHSSVSEVCPLTFYEIR